MLRLNKLKHKRELLTNSVYKISEFAFSISVVGRALFSLLLPQLKMLYFFEPLPSKCSCTNSSEMFHVPSTGNFTIGSTVSFSLSLFILLAALI